MVLDIVLSVIGYLVVGFLMLLSVGNWVDDRTKHTDDATFVIALACGLLWPVTLVSLILFGLWWLTRNSRSGVTRAAGFLSQGFREAWYGFYPRTEATDIDGVVHAVNLEWTSTADALPKKTVCDKWTEQPPEAGWVFSRKRHEVSCLECMTHRVKGG
jgi:hypothetical protein